MSEQIITVEKTKQGKGEVKSEGRPWVNRKMASDSLWFRQKADGMIGWAWWRAGERATQGGTAGVELVKLGPTRCSGSWVGLSQCPKARPGVTVAAQKGPWASGRTLALFCLIRVTGTWSDSCFERVTLTLTWRTDVWGESALPEWVPETRYKAIAVSGQEVMALDGLVIHLCGMKRLNGCKPHLPLL